VQPRANNLVHVVNQSGGDVMRDSVAVATNPAPRVANVNAAVAYASCTDCWTVAVAVQIVLIGPDVSDFQPVNAAVALNVLCVRCDTFAYATQVVASAPDHFRLSQATMAALDALGDQIDAVTNTHAPFFQLDAQLDALTDQMCVLVNGDLTAAGAAPTCTRASATQLAS
jgi:putative peptide zinc metalloprotease protein